MINRQLIREIIAFGVVGVICFIIDATLFYIQCTMLGIPYIFANCISFSLSTIINYRLSKQFVFLSSNNNQQTTSTKKEYVMFFGLAICGLGIQSCTLTVCLELIEADLLIGKIIATSIAMVFNYITRKQLMN